MLLIPNQSTLEEDSSEKTMLSQDVTKNFIVKYLKTLKDVEFINSKIFNWKRLLKISIAQKSISLFFTGIRILIKKDSSLIY